MRTRTFDLLAIAGIFLVYSITIRFAMRLDLVGCLLGGAANTIPVVIFGLAVRYTIIRRLVGKPLMIQLVAHILLCAAFISLSYCLLIVLLGLFNGASYEGFVVRPFSTGGMAWQTLENVTTYALLAAVSYLQAQTPPADASIRAGAESGTSGPNRDFSGSMAASETAEEAHRAEALFAKAAPDAGSNSEARADKGRSRYFVRIGDELRPLDIDTVVSIAGADDYAEVRTSSGKHLVRVTLAEFAASLDPTKYVRVHRSWIVNIHRIAKAEPAGGGRLLLHMETGQAISTSRAGARLVRDRVL